MELVENFTGSNCTEPHFGVVRSEKFLVYFFICLIFQSDSKVLLEIYQFYLHLSSLLRRFLKIVYLLSLNQPSLCKEADLYAQLMQSKNKYLTLTHSVNFVLLPFYREKSLILMPIGIVKACFRSHADGRASRLALRKFANGGLSF